MPQPTPLLINKLREALETEDDSVVQQFIHTHSPIDIIDTILRYEGIIGNTTMIVLVVHGAFAVKEIPNAK